MKVFLTILAIGSLSLPTSCDEETNYRILSFFFDGVPPPGSKKVVVTAMIADSTDSLQAAERIPISKLPETNIYVHQPYKEKRCNDCHETGFSNKLIESQVDILCESCHEKYSEKRLYTHGPVAVGQCLVCHNPHRTKNEHLLIRPGQDLCTFCHEALNRDTVTEHQMTKEQKCESCHSPHFSNVSKLYLKPGITGG